MKQRTLQSGVLAHFTPLNLKIILTFKRRSAGRFFKAPVRTAL
jgi:hypothetical protein